MADTIKQLTNEQKTILIEVSHLLLISYLLLSQLVLPIVTGQSTMDVMSEGNNRLSCLENYREKKKNGVRFVKFVDDFGIPSF